VISALKFSVKEIVDLSFLLLLYFTIGHLHFNRLIFLWLLSQTECFALKLNFLLVDFIRELLDVN
jgi:hypothetical protein